MARQKKPSGRLSRGPWEYRHFRDALNGAGWIKVGQEGSHVQLTHPTRAGRVTIDTNWTGVKVGHDPFKSVAQVTGYGKKELQRLLDRVS
jgi:predicted RNA binding protein YcfA (HicA-like mRNA interferase family)